ncbi:MAG: hypothetical protein ABW277_10150 [Longimicrobiaceae bacterium]
MLAIYSSLQNPLTKKRNAGDRTRIATIFPDVAVSVEGRFLALRRYVYNCPERFFSSDAHHFLYEWLQDRDTIQRSELQKYLEENENEINRALLFLREINAEPRHDKPLEGQDDYGKIRLVDTYIHPTYLRLIEAVLIPFIRPVAYFSRLDRAKGTDGLDVWSVIQELSGTPADCLAGAYHHLVRNGIAHGGITYLQNEIRYRDKKGNEEVVGVTEIIRVFDTLVDACNGIAAAYKRFWVVTPGIGYKPPQQFFVEELQEETRTPWWNIEGCVESEVLGGRTQLTIYARVNTRDVAKVNWSTIQSGILAEFFAPGYDRYFFSLRSPRAWPGWAAFNGQRLASLRLSGAQDLSEYHGIVEDNLIFYIPHRALPRPLGKVDTFWQSMKLQWPLSMEEYRQTRRLPKLEPRNAKIHRNGLHGVLNASVVLLEYKDDVRTTVRAHKRRIVKIALKAALANTSRANPLRALPLGFARIAVFEKDYRQRRLSGFGLGSDLICTVQFQRLGRISAPDIYGSTIEHRGKWRIAWNKRWLEKHSVE